MTAKEPIEGFAVYFLAVLLQYFPTVICGHAVLEVCKKKLDIIS
tara:strand:+ start:1583 stop:1714 length:132 start_codon:yes stop_codon:yes gene_type:complete